jgi:hypothetical protein
VTTKEFLALEKKLLPHLPGFAIAGRLLIISPIGHLLRGISFESSAFDKMSFYVNTFVLPLCVPTEHLYLNFGSRVRHEGGGDRWNIEMPDLAEKLRDALKREALPFLQPIKSLDNFVDVAKAFSFKNPHTVQAIAYALARVGNTQGALSALNKLSEQIDLTVPWQQVIAERAEVLMSELRESPLAVQHRLETWEDETLKNLRLEEFR